MDVLTPLNNVVIIAFPPTTISNSFGGLARRLNDDETPSLPHFGPAGRRHWCREVKGATFAGARPPAPLGDTSRPPAVGRRINNSIAARRLGALRRATVLRISHSTATFIPFTFHFVSDTPRARFLRSLRNTRQANVITVGRPSIFVAVVSAILRWSTNETRLQQPSLHTITTGVCPSAVAVFFVFSK